MSLIQLESHKLPDDGQPRPEDDEDVPPVDRDSPPVLERSGAGPGIDFLKIAFLCPIWARKGPMAEIENSPRRWRARGALGETSSGAWT
jgi:hypothetical protein